MLGHVIEFSSTESHGSIHPDDDDGDLPFRASSVDVVTRSLTASERFEFALIYGPKRPEAVDVHTVG